MANDNRDRSRRGGWREDENRGMFGYEGEGYMRGGGRDVESDLDRERDFGGRGYDRGEYGGYGSPRGGGNSRPGGYDTEFTGGGYSTGGGNYDRGNYDRGGYDRDMGYRGGYGDFNRGDYATGGGSQTARDEQETGSYSGMAGGSIGGRWGRAESQSHRGKGPKNYQRSDERIREEVCERLSEDHYVDASEIEVNVSGGVVTLTGSVNDRSSKRRAEDIAESATGVKEVQNQIRLGGREVDNG